MSQHSVGIVTVNYNGEEFLGNCIESLQKMNYDNYKIIVVDNNSKDNSIKLLKEKYPDVKVIESKENTGSAKGNNLGIQYSIDAGYDYTLTINNDTEVDKDMLKILVDKADEKMITVPKMYYFDRPNVIWFAGGSILWNKGITYHRGVMEEDKGQYDQEEITDYAPTTCMLINNKIFKEIGLLDENYFLYYEDTDFYIRAKQHGCEVKYVPSAKMWHKVSCTTGGQESQTVIYYNCRNRLYFMDKFKDMFPKKAYIYTYATRYLKYYLSFFHNKKNRCIKEAIKDYKKGNMYRKEF